MYVVIFFGENNGFYENKGLWEGNSCEEGQNSVFTYMNIYMNKDEYLCIYIYVSYLV